MRNLSLRLSLMLPVVCSLLLGAGPPDLSGFWVLNVGKSTWGSVRKPLGIFVEIDHKEPNITYSGKVTYQDEEAREFHFAGAADGKEYPMNRSFANGKVTIRRSGERVLDSTFKSDDGRYIETAHTSLSRDGAVLTRQLTLETPAGRQRWTEVYERRQR